MVSIKKVGLELFLEQKKVDAIPMKYDVNAIKYLFQISITECAEVVSLVTFTNKQVRVGLQIIVHSLDGFGCC